jgi:ankyrin repeat protein
MWRLSPNHYFQRTLFGAAEARAWAAEKYIMNSETKPTLFSPGIGKRGMTALHFAAYCGDLNELTRALSAGLDPNSKDSYRGYAAIHWLADMAAAGGPRSQMLRLLVERGADVNLVADNGTTARALAIDSRSAVGEYLAIELTQLGACE